MLYLEQWIREIVKTVLGTAQVTRSEVEAYQFLRLRQALRYSYERSSFYRALFDKACITPVDIHGLHDLSKIPFTEPHHLSESPYRFLCVSQAEVARPYSFVTSGTTGPRKRLFWSQGDLERIIEFMAAGIATVADAEDTVQIMLADGRPYSQADLLYQGVQKIGATPVLAGMDLNAEEHWEIIQSSSSTVLFGYTERLFRISKELQAKRRLSASGVRALFAAGAYMPDAMRRQMQRLWNCPVHTHYGLTEMGLGVAVECEARNGYHFNEAGLLLEVIDPRTGKVVPPGEEGELVFTTLTRDAMPLIRYRTHDISRLLPDPCPCGATTLLRIDSVRKRLESIIALEGNDQIYPSLFDDVLFEIPELIDYRAVLKEDEGKDYLDFTAETTSAEDTVVAAIGEKLLSIPVIAKSIRAGRMAEPRIHLTGMGALQSTGREKKSLVDNRQ